MVEWMRKIWDFPCARLAIISGAILLLDQATKLMVLSRMDLYQSIPVIPGFFNLTHIHNPGGAFGFLAARSTLVRHLFFVGMTSLAILVILFFYNKTARTHSFLSAGFALIFGGAVGNLVDRIWLHKVVDFLDFYIGSLHWPAFNIADSAITVGICIFAYHFLFNKMPE